MSTYVKVGFCVGDGDVNGSTGAGVVIISL